MNIFVRAVGFKYFAALVVIVLLGAFLEQLFKKRNRPDASQIIRFTLTLLVGCTAAYVVMFILRDAFQALLSPYRFW